MSLLTTRTGCRYYDPWEEASDEQRAETIGRRLADYVDFARLNVPLLRDRLAGYRPDAAHPLADVPVMTADELRTMVPPAGSDLLTSRGNDYTVFQSGGTTGVPKTTLFTHGELDGLDLPNARGFYAVGLRAEDRVANLFAVGGLYMTFVHINRCLQQYGCLNFPFSNQTPPAFVGSVAELFKINVFTGIASVVLGCLRSLAAEGAAARLSVDKVFYGGEHLYEADVRELQRDFGVSTVAAPGYGTVDSWYLGYGCQFSPTGTFHAHDDQVYLEIVADDDPSRPCPPGEAGTLLATAYPRRLTPIVRFRVGDRARWLTDRCPCGRTTPRFELLGRGDDVLRIGYDSIDYRFVQDTVATVEGLSGTVQIEKCRRDGRDQLVVRVESAVEPSRRDELAARLSAALSAGRPSLAEFVAKGTVWPVQVEIVDPGSLPRNPRTGKLMRVIDAI